MSARKKHTPTSPGQHQPTYRPPQPLLDYCGDCGCLVQRGITLPHGKILWVAPTLSPVSGNPHDCDQALALELALQGLRWNTVMVLAQQAVRATWEAK